MKDKTNHSGLGRDGFLCLGLVEMADPLGQATPSAAELKTLAHFLLNMSTLSLIVHQSGLIASAKGIPLSKNI